MIKGIWKLSVIAVVISSAIATLGQNRATFTGTILSYGSGVSTRTTTQTFALTVTGVTSDAQAQRYLNILDEGGQSALLNTIDDVDLGTFVLGARLGNTLNGVRVHDEGDKRIIRCFYARRIDIREVRSGYRSRDYPFGYLELVVDPKTGKGDGTYIGAAQIRIKTDKRTGKETVEIESFATYPSKVLNVQMRGRMSL